MLKSDFGCTSCPELSFSTVDRGGIFSTQCVCPNGYHISTATTWVGDVERVARYLIDSVFVFPFSKLKYITLPEYQKLPEIISKTYISQTGRVKNVQKAHTALWPAA